MPVYGPNDQIPGRAQSYAVTVRYRTNSGCNATIVNVEAETAEQALEIACTKIKRRRGVIRIDGGEWRT